MINSSGAKNGREMGDTYFFLLEPKSLCDSGEVARRLAKCKGVKEVHLTSGKYGFVVSTDALPENVSRITSAMKKSAVSVNVVISHYKYLGSKC
jgi:hypothetical protein